MLLMQAKNVVYSIGDRELFHIDELKIHAGEKIGMVGKNGQGKTMLVRYLMGELDVPPQIEWYSTYSWMKQLNNDEESDRSSGGEKTLKKLERLFGEGHEVLFLDEPTNNLDMEHVDKLEQKLGKHDGAFLIISHDRMLLDRVCDQIWELDEGTLSVYNGNYSFYQEQKELEREQQYQEHAQYVKEKGRIEDRIRQKRTQSKGMRKPPKRMGSSEWQLGKNKAAGKQKKVERVSKTLERRLERLEKVDKPFEWDQVKMEFNHIDTVHNRFICQVKNVNIGVGSSKQLFHADHASLKTGSKTALLGGNGSGKSTFIQHLLDMKQELMPHGISVGYFNQKLEDLPQEEAVLPYVRKESPMEESMIRIILARLKFFEEDMNKPISSLSGGERVKLALARLLVSDAQLLILDEPTNHLDLEAIQALEQLVREYPGTILFVTHDRKFVERTADQLWVIEDEELVHFDGGWDDWQDHLQKPQEVDELVYDVIALETKLTELISRLSMPAPTDDVQLLEKEYEETLRRLKQSKAKEKRP